MANKFVFLGCEPVSDSFSSQEPAHWLKRDMWVMASARQRMKQMAQTALQVAFNGSLCYFSIKENKRHLFSNMFFHNVQHAKSPFKAKTS